MAKYIIEVKNQEITEMGAEAITDYFRTMAVDHVQIGELKAFVTGADSPSLNVVLVTKKNVELNPTIINSMAAFFKKHQVQEGWSIAAMAEIKDIEKKGFNLSFKNLGMYFDLSEPIQNIESSITIKEIYNDLKEWILPLREGFPSKDNCEAYRILNAALLHNGERKLRHFSAYYQGEIAASATLFLSDHSVMLHNLATKNKFKKQGIGTALTLHIMSEAKKLGYRHCFLDSSDEGFNLYTRLGFKTYCKTSIYEINKTAL